MAQNDRIPRFVKPFRVDERKAVPPEGLRPRRHARASTPRRRRRSSSRRGIERLADLQEKLYAQDRWAVLLIFQAMDAAGKDGAIKHVMSGVNPQGCQVYSFKAPTSEELDHDFLWRTREVPPRARPDRHLQPLVLRGGAGRARAPRDPRRPEAAAGAASTKRIWKERFEDIAAFERYLARNGVADP